MAWIGVVRQARSVMVRRGLERPGMAGAVSCGMAG
nr:MAG TPA: hypothetical protein [Caudoviricetes sp.]